MIMPGACSRHLGLKCRTTAQGTLQGDPCDRAERKLWHDSAASSQIQDGLSDSDEVQSLSRQVQYPVRNEDPGLACLRMSADGALHSRACERALGVGAEARWVVREYASL